jgi:uncharacterized protein YbaR (Trm112 family)
MSTDPPVERPADSIDPKLLEILVCPLTKGPLEYDAERQELISRKAKLAYPIRDGIPIMLPEEARRLSEAMVRSCILIRHRRARPGDLAWLARSCLACRNGRDKPCHDRVKAAQGTREKSGND